MSILQPALGGRRRCYDCCLCSPAGEDGNTRHFSVKSGNQINVFHSLINISTILYIALKSLSVNKVTEGATCRLLFRPLPLISGAARFNESLMSCSTPPVPALPRSPAKKEHHTCAVRPRAVTLQRACHPQAPLVS